jgi:hypothetical protein
VGVGNFSLHHRVQNGSGAHPASIIIISSSSSSIWDYAELGFQTYF